MRNGVNKQEKLTESYINFIARCTVPKAMTLTEIERETNNDKTLKGVRAAIKLNKWDGNIVKPFKQIKDELTVTSDGVILRGTRIVIPESLEQRAIDIAHESHQGLTKTKALIREKIWFPNIDKRVENTIAKCRACQATSRPNPPEPLSMTDMPSGPWETVHTDFFGIPSGEYLIVATDRPIFQISRS